MLTFVPFPIPLTCHPELKLSSIDKEFSSSRGEKVIETKLAAFKEEYIHHMDKQLATNMTHLKQVEVAKMRLEERNRYADQIRAIERDFETREKDRRERSEDRETAAKADVEEKERAASAILFENRQRLLEEIERVRRSEDTVKSEAEQARREISARETQLTERLNESHRHIMELECVLSADAPDDKVSRTSRFFYTESMKTVQTRMNQLETELAGSKQKNEECFRQQTETALLVQKKQQGNVSSAINIRLTLYSNPSILKKTTTTSLKPS